MGLLEPSGLQSQAIKRHLEITDKTNKPIVVLTVAGRIRKVSVFAFITLLTNEFWLAIA